MRNGIPSPLYALVVTGPRSDGGMRCQFQQRERQQSRTTVYPFLTAIATWLNDDAQDFLASPVPENYVRVQPPSIDPSIVVRSGLLKFLNAYIPARQPFKPHLLSQYSKNIWLFWEQQCMPISALFSDEMKACWVVEMMRRENLLMGPTQRVPAETLAPFLRACGRSLSVKDLVENLLRENH